MVAVGSGESSERGREDEEQKKGVFWGSTADCSPLLPGPLPQAAARPFPSKPPLMNVPPTLRGRATTALAAGSFAYTLVLVFMTHYPKPQELLGEDIPPDKLLHFLAYGLLGLLVAGTIATAGRWSARSMALTTLALAAFAALDELTQPWFQRSAEPLDWVWDCIGLVVGIVVVAGFRHLLRSQRGHGPLPAQ